MLLLPSRGKIARIGTTVRSGANLSGRIWANSCANRVTMANAHTTGASSRGLSRVPIPSASTDNTGNTTNSGGGNGRRSGGTTNAAITTP